MVLFNSVCKINTGMYTTNTADGSVPLSLFHLISSNIRYLRSKDRAKVNKVSSKTFHFSSLICWQPGAKNTQTSTPDLSIIFYGTQKTAAKLQSLPTTEIQPLGEMWWLFRGLKLVMTLKCRVWFWFLIVQWFYMSSVILFRAKILLPYFSSLRSLKFVSISGYLQTATAENLTVMQQRMTVGFVTCHREETRIVNCFCKHVPCLICLKLHCLVRLNQLHVVITITAQLLWALQTITFQHHP